MAKSQDPTEVPEEPGLSPSIAQYISEECPRVAWAHHRLLGDCVELSEQQIAVRERGSVVHNLVLEDGNKVAVIDSDAYRSSAAKADRDQARAAGLMPVLKTKIGELRESAENIRHALLTMKDVDGEPFPLIGELGDDDWRYEERLVWDEPAPSGNDVECHGVADIIRGDGMLVVDLKTTTASVNPAMCSATLLRSAGIIQGCAYPSAMGTLYPEVAGRVDMVFAFAQSKPPFMVTALRMSGEMRTIGEGRWLRAIDTWDRCLSAGKGPEHWPAYTDGIGTAHAPAWAMAQELEKEMAE